VSEPPGPPRDEALVAYVEGIEAALRARRGSEVALSPRDFALARTWHEAGVPLATVLVALDLAFDVDPQAPPASLAVLRRRVEELAAVGPRPAAAGLPRETERPSLPDVQERLAALRERLLELPGRVAARPLADVEEVADLVAVASRPNWDYLRGRLRRIDETVAAAAVEALAEEDSRAVLAEADRATARHRGRVDDHALDEARARLVRQRARERLRLPRVSVD
jgi:hypothetical protein